MVRKSISHTKSEGQKKATMTAEPTGRPRKKTSEIPTPTGAIFSTYLGYLWLFIVGYVKDFFSKYILRKESFYTPPGYAPLLEDFNHFYARRLYTPICDCWNRPINSTPGAWIDVMERKSKDGNRTFELTGKSKRCLNLGSYNYLGFAENDGPCVPDVHKCIEKYSVSIPSTRMEYGSTDMHEELETLVAEFLGKPSAMVFGMGFGTNSTTLPALADKGSLLVSDALNHRSLVIGARSSEASVRVFQHNDIEDLERVLRKAIVEGQPRTRRPWKKIIIVVEGIYSMEGETLDLASVVELKKKYKCYLYVDEAHSIGALGMKGRGICEHCNVDPADVDILMGTFTKSFGAVGGYIASSKDLITYLRARSYSSIYDTSLSPPCCAQILSSFRLIIEQGKHPGAEKNRMTRLKENSNYFRTELVKMGFVIGGDDDSPVIPMMLFHPAKIPVFSRMALERNLAVVVVGFPATPILLSRARFCVSAAHTKEDLDNALSVLSEIGDKLGLKLLKGKQHQ